MNKNMDRRDFMKTAGCASAGLVIGGLGISIPAHAQDNNLNPNGMDYSVLQKNKAFSAQAISDNTIYEIRNDFDLGGQSIKLPASCILKFEGGKINRGTLTGNNTLIDAPLTTIFGPDVSLSGTWRLQEVHPEWFGAVGDGKSDDVRAIQRAIDTCSSLKSVNTVLFSDGEYLINTPINLNSDKSFTRHNICLKGSSMPFTSVGKGVRIIGNTGGSIIEAIDSVNCVIENIALFSGSSSKPSTIGVVIARGDLQYVPKFTMRNSFVSIGFNQAQSRNYNGGFGSIGLLINDAEESIFDNVEVCANLCVGVTHNGKMAKYSVDEKGVPKSKIYYTYKPFFNKKFSYLSNTLYRFNNCRFLSKGKISPAVFVSSTSDANFFNCFFQTSKWGSHNGNVNYAMYLGALRNSTVKASFEGYGTAIVCDSEISNCDIRMVIDGRDSNGVIHIVEPDRTERNWYNNNISVTSNEADKPLFVLEKNHSLDNCLIGLANNNICSNTKDRNILPAFDILKRDNNLRLSNVSYLEAGRYHGRIISDSPSAVSIDESKYYHLWDYLVGSNAPDSQGSSCSIEDFVTCLTANTGSPAPTSYNIKIIVEIMNMSSKNKPSFQVRYSFTPIYQGYIYASHQIESIEPVVVFNNDKYKVSCFVRIKRKNHSNTMRATIAQEIEYNGTPIRSGRQILVANDVISSLKDYPTQGLLKSVAFEGKERPLAPVGFCYFDTSLSPARPVWFNGKDWVDANGKVV